MRRFLDFKDKRLVCWHIILVEVRDIRHANNIITVRSLCLDKIMIAGVDMTTEEPFRLYPINQFIKDCVANVLPFLPSLIDFSEFIKYWTVVAYDDVDSLGAFLVFLPQGFIAEIKCPITEFLAIWCSKDFQRM